MQWRDNEFKVAINMAGAISAGAYTAGVLDFLTEALEEWQKAKDDYRKSLQDPNVIAAPVPLHDITIEVFSGASAGGMCAAIASVMVQQPFSHIQTGQETNTTNTFYESWVNKIDILPLLGTTDISSGKPLISLLDCTIIDQIADYALVPKASSAPPYISADLSLFLTLSNVRGVPYQLYNAPSSVEEFVSYYGDRLQFEVVQAGQPSSSPFAKPLPSGSSSFAWPLLKEAAKATGAFPLFLAPRILTRDLADYTIPLWQPLCGAAQMPVPPAMPPQGTWRTLNVDGGVTNNSPFQLGHDFLAGNNPKAQDYENPRDPTEANCAVITVAPFPSEDVFDPNYSPEASSAIWSMLGRLASVLISQSRFLGESLQVLTSGTSFSRFVIAPSDPSKAGEDALQGGALGAFGGFFERGFRAHDFLLGRRNCQKFLLTHFCLPVQNGVIAEGLQSAGDGSSAIQSHWCVDPPNSTVQPQGKVWIPLIPLCGAARNEVPFPTRGVIPSKTLDTIVGSIIRRLKAITPQLFEGAPAGGLLTFLLKTVLSFPVSMFVKKRLRSALAQELCPNVEGQKPEDCNPSSKSGSTPPENNGSTGLTASAVNTEEPQRIP
jgi:predicted acylesterase/phospholipase RssA